MAASLETFFFGVFLFFETFIFENVFFGDFWRLVFSCSFCGVIFCCVSFDNNFVERCLVLRLLSLDFQLSLFLQG